MYIRPKYKKKQVKSTICQQSKICSVYAYEGKMPAIH